MKVYKYGTGQEVPEGAIYLTTVVEVDNVHRFVWHYFLIDVKENESETVTERRKEGGTVNRRATAEMLRKKTYVNQDVCECGHKKQDHIWDNHGKEILGSCSYDNPVCDCQEFQVPDKSEPGLEPGSTEDDIKKELDKDYES